MKQRPERPTPPPVDPDLRARLANLDTRTRRPPKRTPRPTLEERITLHAMHPADAGEPARARARASERRQMGEGNTPRGDVGGDARTPSEPRATMFDTSVPDPTVLADLVLDQLVADIPEPIREIARETIQEIASKAARRDADYQAKGLARRRLDYDDYAAAAAEAVRQAIPGLAVDRVPEPYLRTAASHAVSRLRRRDLAARPLGLKGIPPGTRDAVRFEPLDDIDRDATSCWAMPREELLELRRVLTRQSPRGTAVLEGALAGYSAPELAVFLGIPLRTITRETGRLRGLLARIGFPWPVPVPGRCVGDDAESMSPGRQAGARERN